MNKFKVEEWQKFLDNSIPGYSRTVNIKNLNNTKLSNLNSGNSQSNQQIKSTLAKSKGQQNIRRDFFNKNSKTLDKYLQNITNDRGRNNSGNINSTTTRENGETIQNKE